MMKIHKIIVTGDFLRVNAAGISPQDINIRWLYHLIHSQLSVLCELPISAMYCDISSNGFTTQFYASEGLSPTLENWAHIYERMPNTRRLALVYSRLANSLVIAFELPEIVQKCLTQLQIPFLDFTIHPVRFLPELLFGVRSNIPQVECYFMPWRATENEMYLGADAALATLSRLPRLQQCQGAESIALFACQTQDDKVLIENGRFIAPDDVFDDILAISRSHEKILVKNHPYAKNSSMAKLLTQTIANADEVDANFYHVLSHESVSSVYSLTSSTSIEARYFQKQGIHLKKYPYIFSSDHISDRTFMNIYPCFLEQSLWKKILQQLNIQTVEYKCRKLEFDARKSLRNYWGADILYANHT